MMKKYLTKNAKQTQKLGADLAKILFKKSVGKSIVIGLEGDLGSGKTTFLQGFARGLGIKEKILSPTFVIMKRFAIKTNTLAYAKASAGRQHLTPNTQHPTPNTLYHIDCYRLEKPKELLELGLKEIIRNPKNIIAIEWADKVKKILPENTIFIKFQFIDKNKRKIAFCPLVLKMIQ
jgi:tRNA threonylcarbamoyladenosine biosynthesis protein TsaE